MSAFAGVDGGGTRTRAVIVDADGRELGRADFDGAVVTAHEPERAAAAVRRAVARAAAEAGVTLPVRVLWAGLAGAGAVGPREAVTRALGDTGLAARLVVGTDVEAAFHHAFPSGPGILLIAGTGSIVWARDGEGKVYRVGGWGRFLGDDGSGYRIGLDGLRYLTRAEDGRAPPTRMREALLSSCGAASVEELVAWTDIASKAEIAALAPLVVECADAGDPGASEVVDAAVASLCAHFEAVLEAMRVPADGRASVEVVLWGGLVAPGGPLERRMTEALAGLGATRAVRDIDPPMGAARLARGCVPA